MRKRELTERVGDEYLRWLIDHRRHISTRIVTITRSAYWIWFTQDVSPAIRILHEKKK